MGVGCFGTYIGDVNILGGRGPWVEIGDVNIVRRWRWGFGAVIGDVNIVGVGDEVGEQGRDWNTDIVGVGTEILEYLFNVTDSKNT